MPKTITNTNSHRSFRDALCRFAAIAPLVARRGASQAEIATLGKKLVGLTDLALGDDPGGLGAKERDFLDYARTGLHTLLDQAEVAATFTGAGDGAFQEHHFAANLAGADIAALHTAARFLTGDTAGLKTTDIAAAFHAFDGVSAGFGPGLLERIKALIVAILSFLARLGIIKAAQVQRAIDILARIDEILGGEVVFLPPAPPTKRFVTLDAGERLTVDIPVPLGKTAFFQRVAFDDERGGDEFVDLSILGVPAGRLTKATDVVAISGPATVTLQFTTQNAGVQAVVCIVTA